MHSQSTCGWVWAWVSVARAVACKGGKTALLVEEFPGWSLWQSCSRGLHFRLWALETCCVQFLSEWTGDQLVFCEERHGHESCIWRVSNYSILFLFQSLFQLTSTYICFSYWWFSVFRVSLFVLSFYMVYVGIVHYNIINPTWSY